MPKQTADTTTTTDAPDLGTKDGQEEAISVALPDLDDGPVTFTRPGVESRDFTVKDGEISTTADGRDWLLRHAVGTPATD